MVEKVVTLFMPFGFNMKMVAVLTTNMHSAVKKWHQRGRWLDDVDRSQTWLQFEIFHRNRGRFHTSNLVSLICRTLSRWHCGFISGLFCVSIYSVSAATPDQNQYMGTRLRWDARLELFLTFSWRVFIKTSAHSQKMLIALYKIYSNSLEHSPNR